MCTLQGFNIVSASLSISIVSEALMLRTCRLAHVSVCLCVCLSVWKVYCGKRAERIQMPFEMVSGVGRGMGVLDEGGDRRRGTAVLEGEFGASHGNQWGLCDELFSNYFEDLFVLMFVFFFFVYSFNVVNNYVFFFHILYFALLPQRRNKVCITIKRLKTPNVINKHHYFMYDM